jgi:hypothetical protein
MFQAEATAARGIALLNAGLIPTRGNIPVSAQAHRLSKCNGVKVASLRQTHALRHSLLVLMPIIGKRVRREIADAMPGDLIPHPFPVAAFVTTPASLCLRIRFSAALQPFAEGCVDHSNYIDLRSIVRRCIDERRENPHCSATIK